MAPRSPLSSLPTNVPKSLVPAPKRPQKNENLTWTSATLGKPIVLRAMKTGRCTAVFLAKKLRVPCSCEQGKFDVPVGETNTAELECEECGHSLGQHENEETLPDQLSTPTVPYLQLYPDICPRDQTVRSLAKLLDERRIVHVRGTPASGKTVLSILLYDYLCQTEKVILLDKWYNKKSASDFLAEQCREKGFSNIRGIDIIKSDFIFIIDEAQQTYDDPNLWYGLIKSQLGRPAGPRFCLFSVYGSPITGAVDYPIGTTPPLLNASHRVSLTKSKNPGAPDVSLFYNLSEHGDVIERFCKGCDVNFTLERRLGDYIYSLTNGHPGMVHALLIYIKNFHRFHLKHRCVSEITFEDVQQPLEDDRKLFGYLEKAPEGRSLPSMETHHHQAVNPVVVKTLLDVLRDGYRLFNFKDEGMRQCFNRGWIQTDIDMSIGIKCFLPSNLHARFVEFSFGRDSAPFPHEKFPDLKGLCLKIIRRFSASILRSAKEGRRFGPSGQRSPESAFQDEFYRCYWLEVSSSVGICSEWSGARGRIDFHIPATGWGIELLRQGDRIEKHLERFRANGIYHSWIQLGLLKDWVVLDYRDTYPKKTFKIPASQIYGEWYLEKDTPKPMS